MSAWPVAQARQLRWLAAQEGRIKVRRELIRYHLDTPPVEEWVASHRLDAWPGGYVGRGPTLLAATADLRALLARHERARRAPRGGP